MKRKKKKKATLILMPQLFMGGSERQVRYIAEGLEKQNSPITVLVENGTGTEVETKQYISEHKGIRFEFLGLSAINTVDKTVKNKIKSINLIYKWIYQNGKKYKWVMFTNLTGLLCVPVCKAKGIKILFNERNPGIKMCNSAIKRKLLKMCNKVVANSKNAAVYMSTVLGIKVDCINNGILEKDLPRKVDEADDLFILVPARINPVKNQLVVLKAINELRDKIKVHCCFAGQIENQVYYNELLDYVKEKNMSDCVKFPGYVRNIEDLYAMTDIVILSSYEEGTPNVVLEAFLNKKLCLASNIVMNRDIVVEDEILFNPDDAEMLERKIEWIRLLDEYNKNDLLKKQYEFVKTNYSIEVMQNKYLDIFMEE